MKKCKDATRGLTDRPLNELPVLTNAMLVEHFDELVTDQTLHLEEVRAYAARGGRPVLSPADQSLSRATRGRKMKLHFEDQTFSFELRCAASHGLYGAKKGAV